MSNAKYSPCIIIPVYNHEHAIGVVTKRLLPYELPIILVDDGSHESCQIVLQALAAEHADSVRLIRLPENCGKGGAVKAALRAASMNGFTHALQIDADGQHNIDDVPKFLKMSEEQQNAVISGCPVYDEHVPKLRFYGRYLTHVWVHINSLSLKIKDSMCGFRLYPVADICRLIDEEFTGNRMDFDSEVMVRWVWRGGEVVGIPTEVQYPLDGVSHFALLRDNILITKMHTRLFFGMLIRLPRLLRRKIFPRQGLHK